jgi:hypothetical protein
VRIHISYGPARKKPRVGDRRTTKKHGEQIRVFRMARWNGRVIGYDCTNGRQQYDWVPLADAHKHGMSHHWTPEERERFAPPAPTTIPD